MISHRRRIMICALALSLIVGTSARATADRPEAPDHPLNFFFNKTLADHDTVILNSNTPGIVAGTLVEDELLFAVDDQVRTFDVDEISCIRRSEETTEGQVTIHLRTGEAIVAEWGKDDTEQTQFLSFRMPTENGQVVEVMTQQIRLFFPAGRFRHLPLETGLELEGLIVYAVQQFRKVTDLFVLNNGAVLAGSLRIDHLRFQTSDGEVSIKRTKIEHLYRTGESRFTVRLRNGAVVEGEPQSNSSEVRLALAERETIQLPLTEVSQFLMNDRGIVWGGGQDSKLTPHPGENVTEGSAPQPE